LLGLDPRRLVQARTGGRERMSRIAARDSTLALFGRSELRGPEAKDTPAGDLRATGPLGRHGRGGEVLTKVRYVRRFFPELDGLALKIGLTRTAAGLAELEGDRLWLNPNRLSLHTIAHELVHLLQGRGLVPHGERSCDLFALAREVTLVDAMPAYLRVPGALADQRGWLKPGVAPVLHRIAVEAAARRERGERRYLRWFENAAAALG
jgi:hypothetical protein